MRGRPATHRDADSRGGDRADHRWGRTKGKIGFHGGKVAVHRPRVRKLGEAILAVAAMPAIKQKLGQLGFEPTSIPGEQFQRAVVNELTTWTEIVEKANIKPCSFLRPTRPRESASASADLRTFDAEAG